ncbi:hypothetical protein BGZ70_010541 [Mortierella alpina]|uniref:Uncharacterized protein n=1 Tax=Mortierella alpina TaxID=64518 RepID=A0A9P6J266_MORAP|nr:hypothetical protein BGZ70_010541 [Mortierella alpina]
MDTSPDYHSRVQRTPVDEDEKELDLIQTLIGNKEMYSPDLINPFLEKAPIIARNNIRIGGLQAPCVFGGDLLIFRATESQEREEPLRPDDWKPYVLGTIQVYDIDCQHHFMYMPEPTAEIGRILSQKLDESHRRAQKEG